MLTLVNCIRPCVRALNPEPGAPTTYVVLGASPVRASRCCSSLFPNGIGKPGLRLAPAVASVARAAGRLFVVWWWYLLVRGSRWRLARGDIRRSVDDRDATSTKSDTALAHPGALAGIPSRAFGARPKKDPGLLPHAHFRSRLIAWDERGNKGGHVNLQIQRFLELIDAPRPITLDYSCRCLVHVWRIWGYRRPCGRFKDLNEKPTVWNGMVPRFRGIVVN
ncbi:uncharacterized protein N7500_004625 [Penicillium coprophilum]|uniref:uncharacterized protein n=1 Tax=Penicillium coprophilum TaxID=36646 RepID=UPI00239C467D|nr:uncharacterized protein N7500_004625 [Penicillium coprophilum]KAJ5162795.1 hypothetical protein N7500_004625 [Penicillium coprophilum]